MAYEAIKTDVPGAWTIVLSGADFSDPPGEASFVWPEGERLTIPRTMVLMTMETFDRLTASTSTVVRQSSVMGKQENDVSEAYDDL